MKFLNDGKSRLVLMAAAVESLAVIAWAVLASGPAEPVVVFEQDGIIISSPEGVATSGGELQRP